MTRRGLVSDRFILYRHQRHVFYALSLVSLLAGAVLVQILPAGDAAPAPRCVAVVQQWWSNNGATWMHRGCD